MLHARIDETFEQLLRRQAARRRIFNMMFVYRFRCCTRLCRALLASPPGSYVTIQVAVAPC